MLNVLIADFFKKEVCPRKLGKMRRIRPRESGMAQESRRTYLRNRRSASEPSYFGNFHLTGNGASQQTSLKSLDNCALQY
jgi:hypothetical protein